MKWFDDEIINSFSYFLSIKYKNLKILSTFFYEKLLSFKTKESDFGSLNNWKGWLKGFNTESEEDLILIPINLEKVHWVLVAFFLKESKLHLPF